jgi:hypothetical protein
MYFRDGTSNMWSLGRVSCIEMAGTGARGHWLGRHVGSSSWAAVRRPGCPVPAASAQSRAPRGMGRAARAAAVSSVALRPVLPSCRACGAADLNLS